MARIDGIYYCPHHPEFGKPRYSIICDYRTPDIGMLPKVQIRFNLDPRKSFVVGDKCVDIKAGKSPGCTTFFVLTDYGTTERDECVNTDGVDYFVDDPYDKRQLIKGLMSHREIPSA